MRHFETLKKQLVGSPKVWLVTGVAGFIGSNLLQTLLELGQTVRGLDNFATGKRKNLDEVKAALDAKDWARFELLEGDIRKAKTCHAACAGVDYVLHQAALGSVPRSIQDPHGSIEVNVNGTVNMLLAARDHRVKRFVYASSSAVYGDHAALPKVEPAIGSPLSPYAATKLTNEIFAEVFSRCYGLEVVGLRYFNVFGPRQDPEGPYAAVIPLWIAALIKNEPIYINGDGTTSRDFCYVANVVQANVRAATAPKDMAVSGVYNVALNERTTLNELFRLLCDLLGKVERRKQKAEIGERGEGRHQSAIGDRQPIYRHFRPGDVMHSQADISLAARQLGYRPSHHLKDGLREALGWYLENVR